MIDPLDTTAKGRFDELEKDRGSTTDRAELCASLTIPYTFMEDGSSSQDDLSREYVQGYGAKLVNNLVGKFALSILPPSQPFYRLAATQEAMEKIAEGNKSVEQQIENVLAQKEDGILRFINKSKFRSSLYPALRLAMITGDALIERLEDDTFRVLSMHNYTIKRDASGNILDLVIKETIDYDALDKDIQSSIDDKAKDEPIDLYTRVYLEEGIYKSYQEVAEETISGSEEDIKKLTSRYISIRWNKIDGEDYGRGFVEDYLGTFISLNKAMKVSHESAAVSAKTVFTVNPNGMTKYKDFVNATNGEAIIGNETDIGTVKSDKRFDLQPLDMQIEAMKSELAESFLMLNVRASERTTAFEVQENTKDLDINFGGIYTALAEDIQVPIIENAMDSLKIVAGGDIDVIITAGVEALGRNVELSKVNNLIQELSMLSQLVGPEAVAKTINVEAFTSAMVVNSGVAGKNFLLTKEVQDANTASAKQDAVAEQAMAGGLNQAGVNAANQMNQG